MTFIVYGIRLRGQMEARYIGQTSKAPAIRLVQLHGEHGCMWPSGYRGDSFGQWLHLHRAQTEAFEIARCDTRDAAKATEAVVISLCLRLGHRLFNGDGVPSHLRIAPYASEGLAA